ncbi:MAG: hypothetical protein QF664_04225 [Dehalococcoidia bacterium]|nr:hypothetical protein [Dehalococcoidia bacterium]
MIVAISTLDGGDPTAAPAAATPVASERDASLVAAALTANIRADPDRFADVIAVLPDGRDARLLGRSSDGSWIKIAYPPSSAVEGWVPAEVLLTEGAALDTLPVLVVLATPTPSPAGDGGPAGESLPDLTIAGAFLLQDGRVAIGLRNIGDAPVVEVFVPLNVSKASGDILGVLRIGPTTLAPGERATVVTPVVVSETGSYVFELDRPDEIRESQEFNNAFTTLLIAGGG